MNAEREPVIKKCLCGAGRLKRRKEHNVVAAIKSECTACTCSSGAERGPRARAGWGVGCVYRAEGRLPRATRRAAASVVVGHTERARTAPDHHSLSRLRADRTCHRLLAINSFYLITRSLTNLLSANTIQKDSRSQCR